VTPEPETITPAEQLQVCKNYRGQMAYRGQALWELASTGEPQRRPPAAPDSERVQREIPRRRSWGL